MIAHVVDELTVLDFVLVAVSVTAMIIGLAVLTRPDRPEPISRRELRRINTRIDEQETSWPPHRQ